MIRQFDDESNMMICFACVIDTGQKAVPYFLVFLA